MKLRMFGATDKGLVRAMNQDAYTCDASRGLVVLSDGMGGHLAGEIASHMVVEGLSEALTAISQVSVEELPVRIDESIQKVNTKLIMRSQEESSCRGMGATVNVLCFAHGFVTIGHVGDSRTYLIRGFKSVDNKPRFGMWSLTIDHNLGTFIDRGILQAPNSTAETQLTNRERSKLTRGMGVMPDPKPDIYTRRLEVGDVFLTCSDGLHGFVSEKDILRTMVSGQLNEIPHRLVELAKAAGAPDNVTVVISVVSDLEEPFRDFTGPVFQTRPYLLRLPNGEIQGPMTCAQITELWIRHSIPGDTEVAAGLGPWLLLRNKTQLLQTYSDFKNESFTGFIYTEPSVVSDYGQNAQSNAPAETKENSSPKRQRGPIVAAALTILVAATLLYWLVILPELSSVLLPAY